MKNIYAWNWASRRIFIISTFIPVLIILLFGSLVEGLMGFITCFYRNFSHFKRSLESAWSKNTTYFRIVELKKNDEDYWGV